MINCHIAEQHCRQEWQLCGINTWSGGLPSTATLSYNDFWDNTPADYCDWGPGIGDISADPLFVDVASGDYHLQVGSPCIDAGSNAGAPVTDIEGTPRDAAPDMGAYEWTGTRVYLPVILKKFGL